MIQMHAFYLFLGVGGLLVLIFIYAGHDLDIFPGPRKEPDRG
jgi:hypothetical protein